jgi:hypothetical protein
LAGNAELDEVQSNHNRCIEQVGIAYNNDINALKNTLEDNRKAAKLKIQKEDLEEKCIERKHAELDRLSLKYAVLDLEPNRCEWNFKNPLHLNHYCLEHLPEAMEKAQNKPSSYLFFKSDEYKQAEDLWRRCVLFPFTETVVAGSKEQWNRFCSIEHPRIQSNIEVCSKFPEFKYCKKHLNIALSIEDLCRYFAPQSQSTDPSQQ